MLQSILYGALNLPWWGYLIALLCLTQLTIFSVTLFLHRAQAHRSLELHPIVSHVFRFWLWLTTGMITKEWAAIHRKHHAKVETSEDPHSPVAHGIKKVFFEGVELYRAATKDKETMARYGEGTPDDWIERHLYARWNTAGIVLLLFVDVFLFGLVGVSMWAIQMAWIPFFAAGVVNGIGHYWGYRNYECKDASRNIFPIGFFIGGEELHNNHHAFGTSAKFSVKWWEFDIGWMAIRMLQFFGLAKAKRVVPKVKLNEAKTQIDADTIKAVITHRLQVLSRYTREVVLPILNEEKKRATNASYNLLSRAKVVLTRDSAVLKSIHQSRLASILENFQSLQVVYQFRVRLQDIWSRSTASQKELLEALQEWCSQAEATGIEVLQRFSLRLRTYVTQ